MDVTSALAGGFLGAVVLALLLETAARFGLTRLGLALLLGSLASRDLPRARAAGLTLLVVGWTCFGLVYAWALDALGASNAAGGAALGAVHGVLMTVLVVPVALPLLHPRMTVRAGRAGSRIESPGALARRYGPWSTPVLVLAHAAYGAVVGAFLAAG